MWSSFRVLLASAAAAVAIAVVAVTRPTVLQRLPAPLTWVAATAGAVAVGLADTAPTGWDGLDLVLRVAFGAAVPIAASRARPAASTWLVIVGGAAVFIADAPASPVAGVGMGALLALVAAGRCTAPSRALAGAAVIGPLAHADWPLATGISAAAMALATAPVLLAALGGAPRPVRRGLSFALAGVVVVLVLGSVAGLAAALSARSDVDRAVDLATDGIDLLGDDDDRARQALYDAAAAFGSADETLTTWWAKPALLVPGVAQQSRAVSTMASAGADLARTAAEASEEADVDTIRPVDGRVDLVALQALGDPLDRSVESLRRADARLADVASPLLIEPVADRLADLRDELSTARDSAELAAHAVDVAPSLLGADGPRRYFFAFQNPAEARGNGGHLGNWAELVADDGQLTLTRNGRSRDLFTQAPQSRGDLTPYEGEDEVMEAYNGAVALWGNINFSPDHPTTSRLISQLYPQSGGSEIDGVVAVTPAALAGFLELTGPVDVEGYPERISSENVERIALHEQYLEFPRQENEDREAFLGEVVDVVFDRLTTGELPGPRAIAAELGPSIDSRNLQLWSPHEDEQALFQRIGATGDASRGNVDSFGVVSQNYGGNKIDWFQHREIDHDVTWDPRTGEVEGTITARVRNEAPSSGLPPSVISWGGDAVLGHIPVADGENGSLFSIYSSHEIVEVTVDGEPAVVVDSGEELGHRVARIYLSVPSESAREVVAHVRGVVAPTNRYVVEALRQPMAHPDELRSTVRVSGDHEVEVSGPGQREARGSSAVTWGNALQPLRMTVDIEAGERSRTALDRLRGAR